MTFSARADVISRWDDIDNGMDGWTKASTNTTLTYESSGGYPGGYLQISANLTMGYKASSAFLGDYNSLGYDHFAFDMRALLQQLPAYKPYLQIRYSGSYNGWKYSIKDFSISNTDWRHYEVFFNPDWTNDEAISNGWIMMDPPIKSFSETMRHVGILALMEDYPSVAGRTLGLDNFYVGSSTAPEPLAVALFGIGAVVLNARRKRSAGSR